MGTHRPRAHRGALALLATTPLVALIGVSAPATAVTPAAPIPNGPVATVAGPLTGGGGINLVAARATELDDSWVREEYTIEGDAVSYTMNGEYPADGMLALAEGESGTYRTRIVVIRPVDPAAFNGTVVVEWLNVSSGFDASPDYTYLGDELIRGGAAWVGVSAQRIGIEGGPVAVTTPVSEGIGAGKGIKALDPERYGDLNHPGDAFSHDIFTQVARTLRTPGQVDPLAGLVPERVIAAGESQSAFMLTTYVNGVHPLTHVFDGFFIHSRGGGAAPLGEPDAGLDVVRSITGPTTTIRVDNDVPVVVLESETDVLGLLNFYRARQPDNDHLRIWEIAGTAHADLYQVGPVAELMGCPAPINAGGQHFVAKAALRHLDAWIRTGTAPPSAQPLEVAGTPPVFVRDENGNALGGIRTPHVDVPVDTLSGEAAEGGAVICLLFGSTTPLSGDRLAELYASPEDYLAQFEAATDAAIEAGFILPEDRDAALADAQPDRITG